MGEKESGFRSRWDRSNGQTMMDRLNTLILADMIGRPSTRFKMRPKTNRKASNRGTRKLMKSL